MIERCSLRLSVVVQLFWDLTCCRIVLTGSTFLGLSCDPVWRCYCVIVYLPRYHWSHICIYIYIFICIRYRYCHYLPLQKLLPRLKNASRAIPCIAGCTRGQRERCWCESLNFGGFGRCDFQCHPPEFPVRHLCERWQLQMRFCFRGIENNSWQGAAWISLF